MFRTAISSVSRASLAPAARTLHSTPVAYKTVGEKVSEVADTVNKKMGKGLASAIEKGEQASQATKETIGSTREKSKEASDVAGEKANQTAAGAKAAKEEFKKEVSK